MTGEIHRVKRKKQRKKNGVKKERVKSGRQKTER